MCGLVGIAGNLEYHDEQFMKRLMLFDYPRGMHSTGFAAIRDQDSSFHIAKMASHPIDLFDTKAFDKAMNAFQSKVFIGHNRYATLGAVNSANAHPFAHGDIVGAHNGTLEKNSYADLEELVGGYFGTDSEAIIAAINMYGVKEVIPMLEGAWALVWYNREDDTLNFIRNSERTLYYAFNKDCDKIVWASEFAIMRAAESIHGGWPESFWKDDKGYSFFPFMTDMHYSFDMEEIFAKKDKPPKPRVRELKGKEVTKKFVDPFPKQSTGGGSSSKYTIGDTVILEGSSSDPFAGVVSQEDFNSVASMGCSFCSAAVEWGDSGLIYFNEEQLVLCSDCSNTASDQDNIVYARNYQK